MFNLYNSEKRNRPRELRAAGPRPSPTLSPIPLSSMSIIQRTAWRAARLPLARYSSSTSSAGVSFETDINTEPEPLEHYEYAPPISRQYRPATGWDDMLMRRNFGEPVNIFPLILNFLLIAFSFLTMTNCFLCGVPIFPLLALRQREP